MLLVYIIVTKFSDLQGATARVDTCRGLNAGCNVSVELKPETKVKGCFAAFLY